MQLTKNFSLIEFTQSATAARLNISNSPNEKELENIKKTAEYLQIIRDEIGVPMRISSGFRSKKLNKAMTSSSARIQKIPTAVSDVLLTHFGGFVLLTTLPHGSLDTLYGHVLP